LAAAAADLVKTSLYDLHKELGGDMVPFAGYELPVLYKGSGENGGVMKEHLWCRAEGKSSLFDVSHMGQVRRKSGTNRVYLVGRFYAPAMYWHVVQRSLGHLAKSTCQRNVHVSCLIYYTLSGPPFLQIRWHGKDRVAFLEKIVVGDIGGLAEGSGCLSLVTTEMGGIIDDTVITNAGDYIYMVVNGATKFGDMEHFR
jgi:aminomethyltransferase